MADIPIFADELEEGASLEQTIEHMIGWFNHNIPRVQWNDEQIDEIFGRRSANRIIEEGHVFYMNPCLPYSLVAYEVLRQNGYEPTLVFQVLENPKLGFRPVHFAVEFEHEANLYYIDFSTENKVYLVKGRYHNRNRKITVLSTYRVPGDLDAEIRPDKNIFEMFPDEVIPKDSDFGKTLQDLKNDFGELLARLKKDNTDYNYKEFVKKAGTELTLVSFLS